MLTPCCALATCSSAEPPRVVKPGVDLPSFPLRNIRDRRYADTRRQSRRSDKPCPSPDCRGGWIGLVDWIGVTSGVPPMAPRGFRFSRHQSRTSPRRRLWRFETRKKCPSENTRFTRENQRRSAASLLHVEFRARARARVDPDDRGESTAVALRFRGGR